MAEIRKTPDEIKKGLDCCVNGDSCDSPCDECPYSKEDDGCKNMMADSLAYIQQLEEDNAELLTKVKQLEAKCHQLERERDALVEAIRDEGRVIVPIIKMPCRYCDAEGKFTGERCNFCHIERPFGGFKWRGVKEE